MATAAVATTNTTTTALPAGYSDILEDIYNLGKQLITNDSFNVSDTISLLVSLMQSVQPYSTITGAQKKAIVLTVITRIITEIAMPDNVRTILLAIPYSTLIDVLVSVSQNATFKKEEQSLLAKLKSCCSSKK